MDVPHPSTLVPDSPAQAAGAAWRLGLSVVAKWSRPWLVPTGTGLRPPYRTYRLVRMARQAPSPRDVPPTDLSDVSDRSDDEKAGAIPVPGRHSPSEAPTRAYR